MRTLTAIADLIEVRGTTAALLIVFCLILWSFYRARKTINLLDPLIENGRLSKISCVFMGSWVLHSWVIVRLTLDSHLTEMHMTSYAGIWVVPIVAKLFAPAPLNAPPPVITVDVPG